MKSFETRNALLFLPFVHFGVNEQPSQSFFKWLSFIRMKVVFEKLSPSIFLIFSFMYPIMGTFVLMMLVFNLAIDCMMHLINDRLTFVLFQSML